MCRMLPALHAHECAALEHGLLLGADHDTRLLVGVHKARATLATL